MTKLGLLAGVFDPFHIGHLAFIEESISNYGLDRAFILIEEKPKFKETFASFDHRKKIVETSIGNNPKIHIYPPATASFPLSSTLPILKQESNAKIYLLVGNDVIDHIHTWPESDKLLAGIELVIADRTEQDRDRRVSSGKVREQIRSGAEPIGMPEEALEYCRANKLYGLV